MLFAVAIVMRYELDIEHNSYGDPVETIYKDKILVMIVFAYAAVMFYLIYGVKKGANTTGIDFIV